MKKKFVLFLIVVMLFTSGFVTYAKKPNKPTEPNTNYNNDEAYEAEIANYSVSINYVKNKGFNARAAFLASEGMTVESIENEYIHDIYPDATMWLWDSFEGLWVPIPLELNIVLDEFDKPLYIEFLANWKDNKDINPFIGKALSGLSFYGLEQTDCWIELAVGNWIEFNVLYPVGSNRTQGDVPEPPYVATP